MNIKLNPVKDSEWKALVKITKRKNKKGHEDDAILYAADLIEQQCSVIENLADTVKRLTGPTLGGYKQNLRRRD